MRHETDDSSFWTLREDGLDADTFHGGEIDPELGEEVLAHRFVHFLGGLLRGQGWWALTLVIEGIHALLNQSDTTVPFFLFPEFRFALGGGVAWA